MVTNKSCTSPAMNQNDGIILIITNLKLNKAVVSMIYVEKKYLFHKIDFVLRKRKKGLYISCMYCYQTKITRSWKIALVGSII